ncbi:MAG TPA: YCF48-related protein [Actinomycetota bacterium]|nr:YCF48-related protein [Actinomycetota bacterium]
MKLVRALVALATLALVVVPLGASSAQSCPGVTERAPFVVIDRPAFPTGPAELTGYAVDAYSPAQMYATNGQALMVTADMGCQWQPRFLIDTLPSLDKPISSVNSTIVDVDSPISNYAHHNVYLTVAEKIGPVTRPHVVVSRDAGNSWKLIDNGLPAATGDILGLYVAPNHPEDVYLHTLNPAGGDQLFASTDGGANWEQRTSPTDETTSVYMAIDPQNPNELWLSGPNGLLHSLDGGRTRTKINSVASGTGMLDVWHASGEQSRVMVYEPETSTFSFTTDSGRTWSRMGGPIAAANALSMSSTSAFDILVSLHQGIYRLQDSATGPVWRWLGTPPRDVLDIKSDRLPTPSFYGRTSAEIVKYTPASSVTLSPFEVHAASVTGQVPHLLPEHTNLTLRPHEQKQVPYKLDLPPLPNPLDVFFVVDTTQSMEASIDGLRRGMQAIIDQLASKGLDVEFGVGEIKDYPIPGYGDAQQGDFPYRLDRRIGPPDDELKAALERLESSGGGAVDAPESQLTGLYQAATGEGDPPWVPAGQDAGFRPGATKVIVNITDAPFHDEPQHPSPPFESVVSALRNKGILQIGLAIYGPRGARGLPDLRRMADETDTVAPEPVDCDGDGKPDLETGTALVCEITDQDYDGALNLAPAIVATLEAVTQEVPVEMEAADVPELVADISPALIPSVDLKEKNELDFDVTYSCPPSLFGKTQKVTLEAKVSGTTEATTTTTVKCKPPIETKKPDKVLPQIVSRALAAPIAVLAPPPPAPPVIENFPGSQSAAQAQGAIATEEQEELQVATVQQRARYQPKGEDEYRFSSLRETQPSPAPLYTATALLTAAFAVATALRKRAQAAVVKNRSRR